MTPNSTTRRLGIQWLIKLRWWAVFGQIITIITSVFFFNLVIPYPAVAGILLVEVATNLILQLRLASLKQHLLKTIIPAILILDILLLTAMLHLTGGPMNPFTFLFMVHLTLGAILLPHRTSWGVTLFTIFCYGLLFIPHLNIAIDTADVGIKSICDINQGDMVRHLQGMWGAFAIGSCLITFFVAKIQSSFANHHDTLSQLEHERLNNERLSSLATLAAGAAHELSTPLAIIGIAAGEIVYDCRQSPDISEDLKEDAHLIKDQVHRCKDILFQMSVDAGSMQGEPLETLTTDILIKEALELLPSRSGITVDNRVPHQQFNLPKRSVSWVIKGLLKNGIDATALKGSSKSIQLTCYTTKKHLCFAVTDNGHGMSPEVQKRASEPFFTTKEAGDGMGLGLFLANSICNRFNGGLSFESIPDERTTATITFALDHITP